MTTLEATVAAVAQVAPGTEPAAAQSVSWRSRVDARRWEIIRWLYSFCGRPAAPGASSIPKSCRRPRPSRKPVSG